MIVPPATGIAPEKQTLLSNPQVSRVPVGLANAQSTLYEAQNRVLQGSNNPIQNVRCSTNTGLPQIDKTQVSCNSIEAQVGPMVCQDLDRADEAQEQKFKIETKCPGNSEPGVRMVKGNKIEGAIERACQAPTSATERSTPSQRAKLRDIQRRRDAKSTPRKVRNYNIRDNEQDQDDET